MEKTWQSEAFFSHLPDTLQNFSQLGWIYFANCKSNQLSINIQWKNVLVVIPRGCNCIAIFHDLLDISTFINWWKLWLYLIISPKKHSHYVLGIYFSISIVLKPDRYFEFDPWVYKLYMYAKIGIWISPWSFVQPQQLSNIHRVNFGVLSEQIELSDWHSSLTSSLNCCCLWPYFWSNLKNLVGEIYQILFILDQFYHPTCLKGQKCDRFFHTQVGWKKWEVSLQILFAFFFGCTANQLLTLLTP